jgi:gliding motility-associated-like protein
VIRPALYVGRIILKNMKRLFFLFIVLSNIAHPMCIGQNLIPNPGFDSIVSCPTWNLIITDSSRINKIAPPWFSTLQPKSSPDIFNRCSNSTTPELGVPYNRGYSYQQPQSGNGYAGIWTYAAPITNEPREYLSTPLVKALNKKSQYFIRFYVSPLGLPVNSQIGMVYTDAIGLALTEAPFSTEGLTIVVNPSIENPKRKFIKDTVAWTAVSGCYQARGGEKYATIGNFQHDTATLFEFEKPTRTTKLAYYYIEDVSIHEFNPLPDTIVLTCVGETQKYNAAFLNGSYKWHTGSTDSVITITKSGTYTVQISIDNCILTDSVVVIVPPDAQKKPQILRGDTTLCEGKEIEVSAAAIPGQYAWSTGAKTPSIIVNKANNYAITVTNRCGIYNDDVSIAFKKCGCKVFVPTAFSPNGDGVNDELEVYFGCDFDYKVKRFHIYNRWGNLVFSSENTNTIKWDGAMTNQKSDLGIHVWFLEYEYEEGGETKTVTESGNFTIIN